MRCLQTTSLLLVVTAGYCLHTHNVDKMEAQQSNASDTNGTVEINSAAVMDAARSITVTNDSSTPGLAAANFSNSSESTTSVAYVMDYSTISNASASPTNKSTNESSNSMAHVEVLKEAKQKEDESTNSTNLIADANEANSTAQLVSAASLPGKGEPGYSPSRDPERACCKELNSMCKDDSECCGLLNCLNKKCLDGPEQKVTKFPRCDRCDDMEEPDHVFQREEVLTGYTWNHGKKFAIPYRQYSPGVWTDKEKPTPTPVPADPTGKANCDEDKAARKTGTN